MPDAPDTLLVERSNGPRDCSQNPDAIPNCELIQIDSGHLPHLERPEEFIRVVKEFLGD